MSVTAYRIQVPAHADVTAYPDASVTFYLEYAAKRHTAAAFGAMFPEAMNWFAAHMIERDPFLGEGNANETGNLMMQRDGDLQRQYQPAVGPLTTTDDAELMTTRYGQAYLRIRNSRAAVRSTVILAGT